MSTDQAARRGSPGPLVRTLLRTPTPVFFNRLAPIARARKKAKERGSTARFEVADIATYARAEPFDLIMMMNMPPFFDQVSALVSAGGHVVSIASRSPATPYYTPAEALDRGFGSRGIAAVASGTSGAATYHVARRPPA